MKISIIIPIYNVESYIADCLNSVMQQTYTGEMECILVDDCGQDKSVEIAEKAIADYKGTIKFSILHHCQNRGLSAARNTGMRAATGDYVFFLDSDDEITEDCISLLARPLQERDYDMVIGDYKATDHCDGLLQLNMKTGKEFIGRQVPLSYYKMKWMPTAWNKLYNLSYLERENLTFKEGLIHEDELWSLEIAATAQSIVGVKEETYIYKIRENSITTATKKEKFNRQLKAFLVIYDEFYRFAQKRNILYDNNYFWLYLHSFYMTLSVAHQISTEKEQLVYFELQKKHHVSLSEIVQLYKFNIEFYILNAHITFPGKLGWWWYSKIYI